MFYTLNWYKIICQLYLNKTWKYSIPFQSQNLSVLYNSLYDVLLEADF